MLYEYSCDNCGNQFEKRVPTEDRNSVTCPECGKLARKKFSLVNATFTWVQDGLTHDEIRRYHDPYKL